MSRHVIRNSIKEFPCHVFFIGTMQVRVQALLKTKAKYHNDVFIVKLRVGPSITPVYH